MAENSIDRKKVRDDLKIERAKLFEQFLKHPMDTRLALSVKIIDDQIANGTEWIRTKEKSAKIEKRTLLKFDKTSPRIDRLLKQCMWLQLRGYGSGVGVGSSARVENRVTLSLPLGAKAHASSLDAMCWALR
jgi:hypothetical protein